MLNEDWEEIGELIEAMRERGFFMAIWSPGCVTNGTELFTYPRWRVHFQRGAQEAAPLIDAEGIGEGETLLEAIQGASISAMIELEDFNRANQHER